MEINLATFFDQNYLSRGVVLINSLQYYIKDFIIYVLVLDEKVSDFFIKNKEEFLQVKLIYLTELENYDKELLEAKNNRSLIEYYFTLSPCFPLYLLEKFNLLHVCTLDADMKFYSSPVEIFNNLNYYSVIITPHKFSKGIENLELYGKYNVSFQIFKNDNTGLDCLREWRNQCLIWCKDELDETKTKYADQKYLDHWCDLYFGKVKVLNDNGTGLAPWNLNNYSITRKDGNFYSNGEKIVFFHFHHNKFLSNRFATNGFQTYRVNYQKNIKYIYLDYWKDVEEASKKVSITEENSIRILKGKKSTLRKFIEEKSFFIKFFDRWIFQLDLNKLNVLVRKALIYINSLNNKFERGTL